jgi:hypothetical protein
VSRKGKALNEEWREGVNTAESVIAMEPIRLKGEYKVLLLIRRSTGLGLFGTREAGGQAYTNGVKRIRVIRHKAA